MANAVLELLDAMRQAINRRRLKIKPPSADLQALDTLEAVVLEARRTVSPGGPAVRIRINFHPPR